VSCLSFSAFGRTTNYEAPHYVIFSILLSTLLRSCSNSETWSQIVRNNGHGVGVVVECDAVKCDTSSPTFRSNVLFPSSRLMRKPSKQLWWSKPSAYSYLWDMRLSQQLNGDFISCRKWRGIVRVSVWCNGDFPKQGKWTYVTPCDLVEYCQRFG
jgi:hypothetical protein